MRLHTILLLAILLAGGALSPGCGSGSGGGQNAIPLAAYLYAIPFLAIAAAENAELCLSNLSADDAPIWVTAFDPFGVAYGSGPVAEVVPGNGILSRALALYTFGATNGGYLQIETRDPLTLDPVTGTPTPIPTSGRVIPVLSRLLSSGGGETTPGAAIGSVDQFITITPETNLVQVVNNSYVPAILGATSEAVDFDIDFFDEDGDPAGSFSALVPADGSAVLPAAVNLGMARVRPTIGLGQSASATTVFYYAAAGEEHFGQIQLDTRLLEVSGTSVRDLGFDFSFGTDAGNNVFDFAFALSNNGTSTQSVIFKNVWSAAGTPIIANAPVSLAPGQTKYVASSTLLSAGLDQGEISPFQAAFGAVGAFQGFSQLQFEVRRPENVQISGRDYDSVADGHYRIVNGYMLTGSFMAKLPISPQLPSTSRHYASLMNRASGTRTVFIRGYTPGGTEYLLPSVDVPAFGRLDWSPDGSVFREVPGDTQGPPVSAMNFLFSTNGGMLFGAREERRAANGLLIFVRPGLVYNVGAE